NGKSMEYPKILRNFDTAFMNQIGVQKCWTPHTVYSGPGNTPRENMTKEWLKTAMTRPDWTTMTDKQKSAAFREYLEKLKDSNDKRIYTDDQIKDLMVSEFGHIDHNHYDVNTHYSDYREWK
ncbi:MAG: hypothetical protein SFU98_14680, partial [Leptospiraceae bacterium]|nr:hypothetical protein [Leptospiraceae bacterium]